MRLLHSSDWQMGLKAQHVARAAEAVRAARLASARRVVEEANRLDVQALVLAGDTFEDNLVEDRLVRDVVDVLAVSKAPVYVLPGNHDALTENSVFRRPSWRSAPPHVVLLERPEPMPIPGTDAVLVSAPLRQKKAFEDPTRVLVRPLEASLAIGVAHGSLAIEGKHAPDDFPIALDAASRAKLDYLARGHWHGALVQGRQAYSGTHEPTRFGEGPGGALLVELVPGVPPKLTEVATGSLQWVQWEVSLDAGGEAAASQIRTRLGSLAAPERTLLRLRTSGRSSGEDDVALSKLVEELGARLLYLTVDRQDLPCQVARGRVAQIADASALVKGLLADLEQSPGDGDRDARRLLEELALETWR